jgi:flagellar hook assembly protein FlgD
VRNFGRWFLTAVPLISLAPYPAQGISFSTLPTISPTQITSRNNNTTNKTVISFTLDSPGEVLIGVSRQNSDGSFTQVDEIRETVATAGVTENITWDALWAIGDEQGRRNGNFQFQMQASTTSGSSSVYTIPTLLTIDSVDVHNTAVSPSFDAAGQPTFPYQIQYNLAKDSYVSVTIVNSSGALVQTLVNGALQVNDTLSSHTVTWNGLLESGRSAPIGIYMAKIQATDPAKTDVAVATRTFAVTSLAGATSDPNTLFAENSYVYPNPVRDGQGIFHFVPVRNGATVTLKIYTLTGDLVRTEAFTGLIQGVPKEFTWDATNEAGRKVGRGLYYYVLREEDSQGTLQVTKKLAVIK